MANEAQNLNAKDAQNSEFKNPTIAQFAADLAAKGKAIRRMVGNNGFACGDILRCKGTISVQDVTDGAGKKTAEYLAVDTDRGPVSIKSLMGISSLRGYKIEGTFDNEYFDEDSNQKKADQVTAEVMPSFDFSKCWQPPTRDYLKLADDCAENGYFEGKSLLFVGTVCKKFTNKKDDAVDFNHDQAEVKVGYTRVMTAKLWAVGTPEEIEKLAKKFKAVPEVKKVAEQPAE